MSEFMNLLGFLGAGITIFLFYVAIKASLSTPEDTIVYEKSLSRITYFSLINIGQIFIVIASFMLALLVSIIFEIDFNRDSRVILATISILGITSIIVKSLIYRNTTKFWFDKFTSIIFFTYPLFLFFGVDQNNRLIFILIFFIVLLKAIELNIIYIKPIKFLVEKIKLSSNVTTEISDRRFDNYRRWTILNTLLLSLIISFSILNKMYMQNNIFIDEYLFIIIATTPYLIIDLFNLSNARRDKYLNDYLFISDDNKRILYNLEYINDVIAKFAPKLKRNDDTSYSLITDYDNVVPLLVETSRVTELRMIDNPWPNIKYR